MSADTAHRPKPGTIHPDNLPHRPEPGIASDILFLKPDCALRVICSCPPANLPRKANQPVDQALITTRTSLLHQNRHPGCQRNDFCPERLPPFTRSSENDRLQWNSASLARFRFPEQLPQAALVPKTFPSLRLFPSPVTDCPKTILITQWRLQPTDVPVIHPSEHCFCKPCSCGQRRPRRMENMPS